MGLQQKNYKIIKQKIRDENNLTTDDLKKIIIDDIDDELLDNLNYFHNFDKTNIKWSNEFSFAKLV